MFPQFEGECRAHKPLIPSTGHVERPGGLGPGLSRGGGGADVHKSRAERHGHQNPPRGSQQAQVHGGPSSLPRAHLRPEQVPLFVFQVCLSSVGKRATMSSFSHSLGGFLSHKQKFPSSCNFSCKIVIFFTSCQLFTLV